MIQLESRSLLSGYIVNDPGNAPLDPAIGPGETILGTITLRSAIQQVNIDGGGAIGFNRPMTILPDTAYPTITAANVSIAATAPGYVVIIGSSNWSGFTLSGGNDTLQNLGIDSSSGNGVTIDSASNNLSGNSIEYSAGDGVFITAGANTIGGLSPESVNVLSANNLNGVEIHGSTATGNWIAGNVIGLNPAGTTSLGNDIQGVEIDDAASHNTIGGSVSAAANIITGNGTAATSTHYYANLDIQDTGSTDNVVSGNIIGTNKGNNLELNAPYNYGLFIGYGATNDTIGGTTMGDGNLIAANSSAGIVIQANDNQITGNQIGTTGSGPNGYPNGGDGIYVLGANNTIGGQTALSGNLISDNGLYSGVELYGSAATGNLVLGNLIGTSANGSTAIGNGYAGINIDGGANSNTIGGTIDSDRNTVSGNGEWGVVIFGTGTTSNLIEGNYIGTNAAGNAALPNDYGIGVYTGGNTIGGTSTSAGNLISGNSGVGIYLYSAGGSTLIEGNDIGTSASGNAAIPNGDQGIYVYGNDSTIGGTTAGAGNVISGNTADGILIYDANNALVEGNLIGTNAAGTTAVPNDGLAGILIYDSDNNTIGGTISGARNVISGNAGNGIQLNPSYGITGEHAQDNLIQGNDIGTDSTAKAPLGNGGDGIYTYFANGNTIGGTAAGAQNIFAANRYFGLELYDSSQNLIAANLIGITANAAAAGNGDGGISLEEGSSDNTIGGVTSTSANVIAYNENNGITVGSKTLGTSIDNPILGNSIAFNTGLGIDINNASPQPAPTVTSATSTASQTTITGRVTGAPSETFRVEFFSNPAGTSQGQTYLGFLNVTTNAAGSASYSFTPTSVITPGLTITATTTDPNGNTSAFSSATAVLSNVTNDLAAKLGSFVYNRSTRQFTQTITITNISGSAIVGPIELVLLNLKNGSLGNQSGTLGGSPYITFSNPGSLGVGQSLSITLVFADPTLATISFLPEFLIGPIPTTES